MFQNMGEFMLVYSNYAIKACFGALLFLQKIEKTTMKSTELVKPNAKNFESTQHCVWHDEIHRGLK